LNPETEGNARFKPGLPEWPKKEIWAAVVTLGLIEKRQNPSIKTEQLTNFIALRILNQTPIKFRALVLIS
jgi:hypothetical protein